MVERNIYVTNYDFLSALSSTMFFSFVMGCLIFFSSGGFFEALIPLFLSFHFFSMLFFVLLSVLYATSYNEAVIDSPNFFAPPYSPKEHVTLVKKYKIRQLIVVVMIGLWVMARLMFTPEIAPIKSYFFDLSIQGRLYTVPDVVKHLFYISFSIYGAVWFISLPRQWRGLKVLKERARVENAS